MRHSAQKRPLNASMKELSVGLEVQRDAALVDLQVKIARHELAALIVADHRRESHFLAALFRIATASLPRKVNRSCSAGEKREKISTLAHRAYRKPPIRHPIDPFLQSEGKHVS